MTEESKEKKKLKWWHWCLIVFGGLIVLGTILPDPPQDKDKNKQPQTSEQNTQTPTPPPQEKLLGVTCEQIMAGLETAYPVKKESSDCVVYKDQENPVNTFIGVNYSKGKITHTSFNIFVSTFESRIDPIQYKYMPQQARDQLRSEHFAAISRTYGEDLARFLKNTAPEWNSGSSQALAAFQELDVVVRGKGQVPCLETKTFLAGDKEIKVQWGIGINNKNSGGVSVRRTTAALSSRPN